MAHLNITDKIHFGTESPHESTSWQTSLDPDFNVLIDDNPRDKVNLLEWYTPLKHLSLHNRNYGDNIIYARVKIHFEGADSEWFVLNQYNQNLETRG